MLAKISISNYALIDSLSVEFHKNLNTVTGETGAGKSIILGALGLILGNRAELFVLKDKSKKCIVEGVFNIGNYKVKSFFETNDLDYDPITLLRREITPAGKSRAFINDTPVNLKTLRELGLRLIDIHSQHETLQLSDPAYQFHIIDSLSNNASYLKDYSLAFQSYKDLIKELQAFEETQQQAKKEYDYNMFLWEELEKANLKVGEQEVLEKDLSERCDRTQNFNSPCACKCGWINRIPTSVIASKSRSTEIPILIEAIPGT